ncbi:uncharacterized protein LOC144906336 [Branchiostoma floridae x Branchiostoma belcheri]
MGTCASVNANQVEVRVGTAVFIRPAPSQTTAATTKKLKVSDATPEKLKQAFKLDFYPKEITDKATLVTQIHKGETNQPFWNVQANAKYELEAEGGDTEKGI